MEAPPHVAKVQDAALDANARNCATHDAVQQDEHSTNSDDAANDDAAQPAALSRRHCHLRRLDCDDNALQQRRLRQQRRRRIPLKR